PARRWAGSPARRSRWVARRRAAAPARSGPAARDARCGWGRRWWPVGPSGGRSGRSAAPRPGRGRAAPPGGRARAGAGESAARARRASAQGLPPVAPDPGRGVAGEDLAVAGIDPAPRAVLAVDQQGQVRASGGELAAEIAADPGVEAR